MAVGSGRFARMLSEAMPDPSGRRWLFVPYDQLSDRIGPLSREDPAELGIILLENRWKAARRPYHKQKLALVLANMRHFCLEQAARGVAVRYAVARGPYHRKLQRIAGELGPVRVMQPAERELRTDLQPLFENGLLRQIPHEGWLTTSEQFQSSRNGPPFRMDGFYRKVRRDSGILMKNGKPAGGKFSFDAENRKAWSGKPAAPSPPSFSTDPVKEEVGELVEELFADHPGELHLASLPATREHASELWTWAGNNCLPTFGPYEDAMSTRSTGLFHTRISGLLNLHRLLPGDVVRDVAGMDIRLASKEGFIRQVLGWREFVHHVHLATDGFDGLSPDFLGKGMPLPPAFWGKPSGLACLDRVVRDVWREGYGHHITRLMILCNLATLLDVSPRELTDWFWVAYIDAYDWVVEPNVLGMGTFSLGDLMTTKPYVSGAAYINRMSDYCSGCGFDPKKNCPVTSLYWAFLERHRDRLQENPRMRMPYLSLRKRSKEQRRADREAFLHLRDRLAKGLPSA